MVIVSSNNKNNDLIMVTRLSVTSLLVPGWVVSGSMVADPLSVSCWVSGV